MPTRHRLQPVGAFCYFKLMIWTVHDEPRRFKRIAIGHRKLTLFCQTNELVETRDKQELYYCSK